MIGWHIWPSPWPLSSSSADLDVCLCLDAVLLLVRKRSHLNEIMEEKRCYEDMAILEHPKQKTNYGWLPVNWNLESVGSHASRTPSPVVYWVPSTPGTALRTGESAWMGQASPCSLGACILEDGVVDNTHLDKWQFQKIVLKTIKEGNVIMRDWVLFQAGWLGKLFLSGWHLSG